MKPASPITSAWTHIAASNTLADHAAGIPTDPRKLREAQNLLGAGQTAFSPPKSRTRAFSTPPTQGEIAMTDTDSGVLIGSLP
jgi:hypothetical protein